MATPWTSEQILELALNTETGSLYISRLEFQPCGADTVEDRRDDSRVVFDELVRLRDEVFSWRHYADHIRQLVASLPLPDGSKPIFDIDRLTRERDDAIKRAIQAEEKLRRKCLDEVAGKSACGECRVCLRHLQDIAEASDGE